MVYSVRIAQIEPVVGLEARAVRRAVLGQPALAGAGISQVPIRSNNWIIRHGCIILELAAQLVAVVPVAQHQLEGVLLLVVGVDECVAPFVTRQVCGNAVVPVLGRQAGFILGLRVGVIGPPEDAVLVLAKVLFNQHLEAVCLHLAARKPLEEFALTRGVRVGLGQVPVVVVKAFQFYGPHADRLLDARHAVQGLLRLEFLADLRYVR
ncbi:MAG: hypothetical protein BWY96_02544 [Spirochaetes bacterium ADurb.BinA120]|nr:MAG: hypothetical protein BWY96_02544 [Spirochaetes bacterium ADurb.BinA120]